MKTPHLSLALVKIVKNIALCLTLILFVLAVNLPIIQFHYIYPEQPFIYLANQSIQHWQDLFAIYLHPKLFYSLYIPFFRPSGHFLIYQLITPFIGWHNDKALVIINLSFLALSGFFSIKLYSLLFPGYRIGGYIAFSIYLMYPALILSRLITLHFEFAYVLFLLMSLYYFIIFCKKNIPDLHDLNKQSNQFSFRYIYLFFLSLALYIIAVTFKEPALMLAPVMALFLCMQLYHAQPWPLLIKTFLSRQVVEIITLLTVVCLSLVCYLTLAWPHLDHPLRATHSLFISNLLSFVNEFVRCTFGIHYFLFSRYQPDFQSTLRAITTPLKISILLCLLYAMLCLVFIRLFKNKTLTPIKKYYRKNLAFLIFSAALFLIMPILWGMNFGWHFNLTLLMLSLAIGFSVEYSLLYYFRKQTPGLLITGLLLALSIGLTTVQNDKINLKPYGLLTSKIIYNAIHHPPPIQHLLNSNSLIVIESASTNDYGLAASTYPLFIYDSPIMNLSHHPIIQLSIPKTENLQDWSIIKVHSYYGGNLFKLAYLMPTLDEMLYPFTLNEMDQNYVPNVIIYAWLQRYHNLFCLGFDKQGNWHNETAEFKKNLLHEQQIRHITINTYTKNPMQVIQGWSLGERHFKYPDPINCRYSCDQDKQCHGFVYVKMRGANEQVYACKFFSFIISDNTYCPNCTSYIKS